MFVRNLRDGCRVIKCKFNMGREFTKKHQCSILTTAICSIDDTETQELCPFWVAPNERRGEND
jgi:hypothetical protein